MNLLRPLSPHLPIYQPQLTSMFPISNRISGAFLATLVVFFYLLCLKIGLICLTYETFYQFLCSSSKLILISVEMTALALSYHLYHGLRHLLARLTNKNLFPLEALERHGPLIIFGQSFFIITSFFLFILCYNLMFPEIEQGTLFNPLQVVAQVAFLLLTRRFPVKPARVRYLLLLSWFLSLISSLYLKGTPGEVLLSLGVVLIIFILFVPVEYAHLGIPLGYSLDKGLAEWGFFLTFQQVGYCALSFFLERGKPSATPPHQMFSLILLLLMQAFYGFFHFGDFYLGEPLKLAALFSGACILFLSLARRTMWAFRLAFLFYLVFSLIIGFMSSPLEKAFLTIGGVGVPHGILIFLFMNLWPFIGCYVFENSLPREPHLFIPFVFSGVFTLLGYFPELASLEKWIEGINLVLLVLGIFSVLEESPSPKPRKNETTKN